jgi:catechol 2,3-dioxygenase-like lactoylglutathione lyase family enzyme
MIQPVTAPLPSYPLDTGCLTARRSTQQIQHRRFEEARLNPQPVKEFHKDGGLMAKFFFVQDPDGYKIEVLQQHGRYR